MIKFFRKIRQNLLSQGKVSKYLLYAIGEIILVVIGILIALQINNWNEENKKDSKKSEYLVNLLAEFKANEDELKTKLANHKFVKSKTNELSNLMNPNPKKISENRLDTLMFSMMYYPEFNAITSLMYSDKIELVNDYKLKNDIANWKLTYESYRFSLKISYDQYMSHIYQFMAENYQIKNTKSPIFELESDKSYFPIDAKTILSNPIFENQVKIRAVNAETIHSRGTKLFKLQENLIKNIELKLKHKK